MQATNLRVQTTTPVLVVEERVGRRRVDFSFELDNGGAADVVLVAIEQDVYDARGGLLQRRTVDGATHIAPGERCTLRNPLPDFGHGIPLDTLLYTFTFRTPGGNPHQSVIRVTPFRHDTAPPAALLHAPTPEDESTVPPTPRRLGQAWFEALYELGVYASDPAAAGRSTDRA